MITCGANGNVVVQNGTESFDLSSSDDYSNLVLKLTSPDEREHFPAELFEVDKGLTGDERAKAERYSEFFSDFINRRAAKLEEIDVPTFEQREASIRAFIERLRRENDR